MINESDIERYFKVNRFKYALGYRVHKYISGNSFKIVTNSNNIVLHVYCDRDTEELFTAVWNRDSPNLSNIFNYERIMSIKQQRDILNIFKIKGFNE